MNPNAMALSRAILPGCDSERNIPEITHRTASFEQWMRLWYMINYRYTSQDFNRYTISPSTSHRSPRGTPSTQGNNYPTCAVS